MARQNLTVQYPAAAGVVPAFTNGHADGFKFVNDGQTALYVKNTDATNVLSVIIETPGNVDGQAVADRTVTVPVSSEKIIGRLSPRAYNRPESGADPSMVYVNLDTDGAVTDAKLMLLHG